MACSNFLHAVFLTIKRVSSEVSGFSYERVSMRITVTRSRIQLSLKNSVHGGSYFEIGSCLSELLLNHFYSHSTPKVTLSKIPLGVRALLHMKVQTSCMYLV